MNKVSYIIEFLAVLIFLFNQYEDNYESRQHNNALNIENSISNVDLLSSDENVNISEIQNARYCDTIDIKDYINTKWKSNLISSLAAYRTTLLANEPKGLVDFVKTLNLWNQWEQNEEKLSQFIFQVLYYYQIENMSFSDIQERVVFFNNYSILSTKFTEQQVEFLCKYDELIDLIQEKVLHYEDPFQIINFNDLMSEMEFYRIYENGDIAEIGAGKGVFSYLVSMANQESTIYINEINPHLIDYAKYQKSKGNLQLNWANIHFVKGNKRSAKIPTKLDKIIIRNSFHHFEKKKHMLKSIRKALKKGGSLFIMEPILVDINERICGFQLKEEELKMILADNNFTLINELKLGNLIYLEYTY